MTTLSTISNGLYLFTLDIFNGEYIGENFTQFANHGKLYYEDRDLTSEEKKTKRPKDRNAKVLEYFLEISKTPEIVKFLEMSESFGCLYMGTDSIHKLNQIFNMKLLEIKEESIIFSVHKFRNKYAIVVDFILEEIIDKIEKDPLYLLEL